MLDIVIAILIAVITLITAYLGVHVTLHPADSHKEKLAYKIGFGACGIVACLLIGWQTYRNNTAQSELRNEISQIKRNTEQPPRVQVTNNIPPVQVVLPPAPSPIPRDHPLPGGATLRLYFSGALKGASGDGRDNVVFLNFGLSITNKNKDSSFTDWRFTVISPDGKSHLEQ